MWRTRISGEPQKIREAEMRLEECCGCGLVHAVFYRIIGKHTIEKTGYIDDWRTLRARRGKRNEKKKEDKATLEGTASRAEKRGEDKKK